MVRAKIDWLDIGKQTFAVLACSAALFALGIALSNWFGQGWESYRTPRTTGYFNFPITTLYVLVLQSCFCLITRLAWISLFIFGYVTLVFVGTFAWSAPNDQMIVAEALQQFHIGLAVSLVVANVLVCRFLEKVFPEKPSRPVAYQLKFDF